MYSYFCYDEIPESLQPSCLVWAFVNSLSTLSSNPTPSPFLSSRALGETLISDKKSEAGGRGRGEKNSFSFFLFLSFSFPSLPARAK